MAVAAIPAILTEIAKDKQPGPVVRPTIQVQCVDFFGAQIANEKRGTVRRDGKERASAPSIGTNLPQLAGIPFWRVQWKPDVVAIRRETGLEWAPGYGRQLSRIPAILIGEDQIRTINEGQRATVW